MRVPFFIIAMLCFIAMIEAHHHLAMPRNYIKNMNKAIIIFCNAEAHKQVQDDEIYTCFRNKLTTCSTYANYSKFNAIRTECINSKGSDCGYGIILAIMIWVVVAICGSPR